MSTVADYVDRTIDVLAYSGALPAGAALLTQELVVNGGSGEICTGMQKLSQRFVLELFTATGSMPYLPNRGCSFVEALFSGTLRTQLDVFTSLSAAIYEIETNLRADATDDDPDDELFESAEVLAATILADYVSVTIQITSVAGETREVILPISVVPGAGHGY